MHLDFIFSTYRTSIAYVSKLMCSHFPNSKNSSVPLVSIFEFDNINQSDCFILSLVINNLGILKTLTTS